MPIYEYRCLECNHQEEHLQKASEPPLTVCPSCGKPSYKKLLSAAGFQLKGSGWYATDYARSGSGNGAKKDSGETAASGGKSEKTSEKAADAKPAESKPASEKSTS